MPNFGKCKIKMRAAIYNPYLDTLGGGERYTMAVAQTLSKRGYLVDVQWHNPKIKKRLEERFGIRLKDVNFVKDIKRGDSYDVCFWLSDGSIPLLKSRKNLLHFQVPFQKVGGRSLFNKMKLFRIDRIICNSYFTKKFIDKEFGINSIVIYPPVDTKNIKPKKKKENLIISVGRFSLLMQSKRQDILIKAFKKLYDDDHKDWKLFLAGGTDVGVGNFVKKLTKESMGYPVKIFEKPSFDFLKDLYRKAKIFWSASGFKVDEEKEPNKVEHFGISIVEAMAARTVPMAYHAGGHKEIINSKENGFLWKNISELVSLTKNIIEDKKRLATISKKAREASKKYAYDAFEKEILQLVS